MENNQSYLKALFLNDSEGIVKIYKNNFYKVKKFILDNNGNVEDAEDIFQKALLQLTIRYKNEPFEIKSSFEGYLFTVCKNLWRRELNISKIKVTNYEFKEPEDDNSAIALSILEQKRWELFNENLEMISENCKRVLKLYFNKKPYSEIVKELNYNSETVVRQRVFKCKTKLIELIRKDPKFKALKEL